MSNHPSHETRPTPVENTTATAAYTVRGYPLLNATQRRKVADRFRALPLGDVPAGVPAADAAHSAAMFTIGVNVTQVGAVTAQFADLNTPNLNSVTTAEDSGPLGPRTRVVGWWQALGLPLFRIGDWTPNGRDTYTDIKGIPGREIEVRWPVAKSAPDGAWEVVLTKAARETPARPGLAPETMGLRHDVDSGSLFAGGLAEVQAVFVRYIDGRRNALGAEWVAVSGLKDLVMAQTNWAGVPHLLTASELHQILTRGPSSYTNTPPVTAITLLHSPALGAVAEALASSRRPRRHRNDEADVRAAYDVLLQESTEEWADDVLPVVRFNEMVDTLKTTWGVSAVTAKRRIGVVLDKPDSSLAPLYTRGSGGWGLASGSPVDASRWRKDISPSDGTMTANLIGGGNAVQAVPSQDEALAERGKRILMSVADAEAMDTWWQKRVAAATDAVEQRNREQRKAEQAALRHAYEALSPAEQRGLRTFAAVLNGRSRMHYYPTAATHDGDRNNGSGNTMKGVATIDLVGDDIAAVAALLEAAGVTPLDQPRRVSVAT